MPSSQNELVLVYRTTDRVEAGALAARLEDADVAARIIGDYRDSAYPGLFVGSMAFKEIWAPRPDEEAAAAIVEQWKKEYHPRDVDVPGRGLPRYSLMGLLITLAIAALVIGVTTRQPWNLVAVATFNAMLLGAYLYFAMRRLRQKRQQLVDDEVTAGAAST